jgi:eukaryotic-like serine/threonine-protein kinase
MREIVARHLPGPAVGTVWVGRIANGVVAIMSDVEGLIGEKLGSFRIESILGSGAMGVVYRGTNESSGRAAAVKVVSGELAQQTKIYERFQREAEILQQFRHPNIVRFLAVGRFRGVSYIAMEFIQGVTLEKVLQDRERLPWREVVELGTQVCDALHYAHERGVVHRDLKPSNLMLTTDGKIKLTDFGIAKDLDKTALTATGRTLGTAAYMAPEQIRGMPAVSHKTDLYALGIVLYQMLVGKPAFEGSSPVVLMHCHLNEPPPRPSSKITEIPKALDELIVSLMAKSPADRPWDAAAVSATLGELRDKAARGEAIAMVWPSAHPTRAKPTASGSAATTDLPRKKTRKSGLGTGRSSSANTNQGRAADGLESSRWSRAALETGALVLALVVVAGIIVYASWPYSEAQLYHKAEALMASPKRTDWLEARDEYLDKLDQRFPDHPYREQTRKWRDKILLEDAERRGSVLSSALKNSLTEPATSAERLFKISYAVADDASKRGDDLAARNQWQKMAGELKPNDPEDRLWYLLALERAETLNRTMQDRRQIVLKLLEDADMAFRVGRPNEAITIRAKLFDDYSRFKDLADLFPTPPVNSPEASGAATSPQPVAPGPSQPAPSTPEAKPSATPAPPQESVEPAPKSDLTAPPPKS